MRPPRTGLLGSLIGIQKRLSWLPPEEIDETARLFGMSRASVLGVASFYSFFRLKPAGKHLIQVCTGTACHVKGASGVYDAFREHLRLGEGGDTDADGLFSLTKVACLGCCMLAPAVRIDDVTFGPVTPSMVPGLLKDFLDGKKSPDPDGVPVSVQREGKLLLCDCTSCRSAGALEVKKALETAIYRRRWPLSVETTGCSGRSHRAPLLELRAGEKTVVTWGNVRPEWAERLLDEFIEPVRFSDRIRLGALRMLDGFITGGEERKLVQRFRIGSDDAGNPDAAEVRIAMKDCDSGNPLDLGSYRNLGGFDALDACLGFGSRKEVLTRLEEAGLRGRGGAGFPSHEKWRETYLASSGEKYVICNGDEGDPGAFMDRMLLESAPFRVIEGMLIAAYVIGARAGYLYIRAEYPLAVSRVRRAIEILSDARILGDRAAVNELRIPFTVIEGAGAFVCGEETALLESMEGRRGIPRLKPPYPSASGYLGRPTLINNVETFANVPFIINDPAAFRSYGSASSAGTKTFALAGSVKKSGLVEVPLGITLRDVVCRLGGGVGDGRTLKAVQIGGPSGGCIPADELDRTIDFDSLQAGGAMMGSGGLIAIDDRTCIVELTRYFMEFMAGESCGRCVYCRSGTTRMHSLLSKIVRGEGKMEDLDELESVARKVKERSLCGLGRSAPNTVLSTLSRFREEYSAHIEGRCPAGTCRNVTRFTIDEACIGCGLCVPACPVSAIRFVPYERHEIDRSICTSCGTCRSACPRGAIHA